jgi:hypothetical protein
MNPRTSKARTNESLAEDLDRASALIGEAMTNAHSHGVIMLEELEKLEKEGLLAAGSPFLVSDEFLEIESDLLSLADGLRLRFPEFVRRLEALFDRVAPERPQRVTEPARTA